MVGVLVRDHDQIRSLECVFHTLEGRGIRLAAGDALGRGGAHRGVDDQRAIGPDHAIREQRHRPRGKAVTGEHYLAWERELTDSLYLDVVGQWPCAHRGSMQRLHVDDVLGAGRRGELEQQYLRNQERGHDRKHDPHPTFDSHAPGFSSQPRARATEITATCLKSRCKLGASAAYLRD